MSTIKANTVTAADLNTDLTLTGNGTGVVNLAAGAKLNGVAFGAAATASSTGIVTQFISPAELASNYTFTSGTFSYTGMSATITPTSASHRICVSAICRIFRDLGYSNVTSGVELRLYDSTTASTGTLYSAAILGAYGASRDGDYGTLTLIQSQVAGTTSPMVFAVWGANYASTGPTNYVFAGSQITITEYAP